MKSQEYWRNRVLYAKQRELMSEADLESSMRMRLKDFEIELSFETEKWLRRYARETSQSLEQVTKYFKTIDASRFDLTLAEFEAKARAGGHEKELNSAYYKSRIARLQKLRKQYQKIAAKYVAVEEDKLAVALEKEYVNTYLFQNYNKYLVDGGISIDLAHFNEQQLKAIVYRPWQGSDFSKRLWSNYVDVIPSALADVMLRATGMGYSYNEIESMLKVRFQDVVRSNLHRLVITEMGHIAEQATAQFYEDSNIEQYEYLATLEVHTCKVCAKLDKQVFDLKDKKEGVNYPLIHPYCRCTTVAYIEDLPEVKSRWYRDPVTGKGKWTQDQPYAEWVKAIGQKPFSFEKWKDLVGAEPMPFRIKSKRTTDELKVLNTRAIYMLGDEVSDRIKKVFKNAPLPMQKLYDKYHDQVIIEDINQTGASYFRPAANKITFNSSSFNQKWREEMEPYFHEVAHMIDFNSKIGGSKVESATVEKFVSDKMLDDWTNDKIAKEVERITKEGLRPDEIGEFDNGDKYAKVNYRRLKFKKDGSLSKVSINQVAKSNVYESNVELIKKLRKQVKEEGLKGYGGLSDAIDAVTKSTYNLGIGHFGRYYKGEHGKKAMGKEFFANYCSALVHGGKGEALMKKYFPKACKTCDEIIDYEIGEKNV